MVIDERSQSTQEAVNPAVGTGNASATLAAYGGTVKTRPPRGVCSNVDRTFKVTFPDGSRGHIAYLAGLDRPHRIIGVSTTGGSAISSASKLIYPLY